MHHRVEAAGNLRHAERGPGFLAILLQAEAWLDRRHQHRALAGLRPDQLKDLGLSQADVTREAGRSFWSV